MMQQKKSNRPLAQQTAEEIMVPEDDRVITRALIGSLIVIAILASVGGAVVVGLKLLSGENETFVEPEVLAARDRDTGEIELPDVKWVDVTRESGIEFEHVNGATGWKLLPETMGGGVAFFDYDNDQDPDLLLINSRHWPEDWFPGSAPTGEPAPLMALYANDGAGQFTDVTEEAGLAISAYGMGVAIGDYDNDGWRDVFISTVGPNLLLKNEQGRFRDVTGEAGVAGAEDAWGTSCGWLDFDRDGLLDLFVCNYITWSRDLDLALGSTRDGVNRAYGPPRLFEGTFPYLYRNEGEGRFRDVTEEMGLHVVNRNTGVPAAKSLGVVFNDIDRDGWTDIIVANDTVPNQYFHNLQGERFEEQGQLMGIGLDSHGKATGAMGIDTAYLRNNESLGIAIGNFANEMASLYVCRGPGEPFSDEAMATGLGPETRLELTFGLCFLDYDLDGRMDLFTANGHLEDEINKVQASQHYEQPPRLFWNAGPRSRTEFVAVPAEISGRDFAKPLVGRGAAYADIDADGDLDLMITASGGRTRLLRNDQQTGHHWLRVLVLGPGGMADGLGAEIEAQWGETIARRSCTTTRSYLSQCEPVATFGLGDASRVDRLEIRWGDGTNVVLHDIEADQTLVIEPPTGAAGEDQ